MTDLIRPDDGVRVRGLRRVEFELMVEHGLFVGEPIELVGGELVEMSPQGIPHDSAITKLTTMFAPLMLRGFDVRIQLPLAVDDVSLARPDVVVTDSIPADAHPSTAHAVIEVSGTSQRMDLIHKAKRYGAAGFPRYVVFDLAAKVAVVHTSPTPKGYRMVERFGADHVLRVLGESVDLARLLT